MSTTLVKPNIGVSKRYRPTVQLSALEEFAATMEGADEEAGFNTGDDVIQFIKQIRSEKHVTRRLTIEERQKSWQNWLQLADSMKGEAQRTGLLTEDDVINFIKTEIRPEAYADLMSRCKTPKN